MPVRKVSNRGGNVIGRFPSTKMGRMIAFESLLERDFIYLLDYDPAVEWFEEQPLSIEYVHEAKLLHYTPDFHLLERGQHVLVECKPERFVDTEENRRKFAVAAGLVRRMRLGISRRHRPAGAQRLSFAEHQTADTVCPAECGRRTFAARYWRSPAERTAAISMQELAKPSASDPCAVIASILLPGLPPRD